MKKIPDVNSLVVLSHEPGATVYRVKETAISQRVVGLIDAALEEQRPHQRVQWLDISLLDAPTIGQLNSLNH